MFSREVKVSILHNSRSTAHLTFATSHTAFKRPHPNAIADYLVIAIVASLPWSTSLTGILVALWALAFAFTIDRVSLARITPMPIAAVPLILVALAILGMFWAQVGWPERLAGAAAYLKLLAIPPLLVQFSRSSGGERALTAFLISATVLLAISWLLVLVPGLPWHVKYPGVPVKDYIIQSGVFTVCFFALLERAFVTWPASHSRSLALVVLAFVFLGNIFFVALGRTSLVVIVVLLILFQLRHFGRRSMAAFTAAAIALGVIAWATSPYLRYRVVHLFEELDTSGSPDGNNSAGYRIQFWKMSLQIVGEAPLLGHGTGSTRSMFAEVTHADPLAPDATTNPHNQILAVAIPLGLAGVMLLLAMWIVHLRMFLTAPGQVSWIGLIVVSQNVVGSLFNSHIFDFTQGWFYVLGVGVAGGMVLNHTAQRAALSGIDDAKAPLTPSNVIR